MRQLFLLFTFSFFYCLCFAQEDTDTSISVFFKTDDHKPDAIQLHFVEDFLVAHPFITSIEGYADSTGTSTYNLELSKKRAFFIYNTIRSNISSLNANTVKYYGESKQFPELWMNRRVQIFARKTSLQVIEKSSSQKINDAPTTDTDQLHQDIDTLSVINLDNLYFYPDKAILVQESIPYLQQLAQDLKTYPKGTFEIIGHINYQSHFDSTHLRDLYLLSEQRAKAVHDYLVESGIPAARMKYKGVGNSKPAIASPKNDEEKRKNMRVQVIILSK